MVYIGSSWTELDYWTSPFGDYDARLRVLAYSTQDVSANSSTVYFKLQKRITGGYYAENYDDLSFKIKGTGKKGDGHSATQEWEFGRVTSTSWTDVGGDTSDMYWSGVKHADDGTCTFTCNASGDRILGGTFDTDISITLPTIPRASSPTITPNPQTWSNTTSNTITVNTNRKSSSFTHTVRCDLWGFQQTKTGVGASTTFDIPYTTLASMPDTYKSFTGSVYTKTYSGSTQIGSEVRSTWTVKVDTAIEHATIGTITIQDTNARTSAVTQDNSVYIANISTLEATIPLTVSGSYTELASATVTCGNKSQSYTLSGTSQTITFTFDKVNASSLSVTVKDKRGNSVTATKTWTLIAYQPVTAVATVGRPSATGSVGVGQLTGMAYGGNFGATQNSLSITIDFKKHDDPDYDPTGTETDTLALTQDGYNSYTDSLTFAYALDYQYQYDIKFTVSDLFSTATYVAQLMQGLPIISWDENEVDVFGNLHIHDRDNPTQWQDVMDGFDALMTNQKNVLAVMPSSNPLTTEGITFNRVIEHRVTQYININGTATGRAFYRVCENFTLESGRNYVLSGFHDNWVEGAAVVVRLQATETNICTAYQDDEVFEAPNEAIMVYLYVPTGTVMDNVKYYPMIRDARIASETYIPYRPLASRWMLSTQRFNSSSVTIAAGASGSVSINTSNWQEGRVPLCILRTWSNGNIIISYSNSASASNLTSVTVWYRNVTSSSTTVYFTVEMLFIDARFMI